MNTDTLRSKLDQSPIPPDAIDALCQRVASDHHRSKGRKQLAERLPVTTKSVQSWCDGDHPCDGTSAFAVRAVAREILEEAGEST